MNHTKWNGKKRREKDIQNCEAVQIKSNEKQKRKKRK
jgi:hypothetical protein